MTSSPARERVYPCRMVRVLLIALLVAGSFAGSSFAITGDEPASHTFRRSPFNAYGLAKLDELRGVTVLIEFWGRR